MDTFPLMTDFICAEEDDLALQDEMASRPPGQMSMFGPAHISKREARYEAVIEEIHAYGKEHQGCSREEIIEQFALRYLGEFRQKDFRFMVKQLVKAKRAEVGPGSVLTAPITFS